jgi:anti-sigma factor RsiW
MRDDTNHCAEFRERLSLYVGGDLADAELDAIGLHLADCESCAAEAAAASRARNTFVDGLSTWRSEVGGADLWPSIREQMLAEGLLEGRAPRLVADPSGPAPSWRLRLLRPAKLVAAAAAIIFLVVLADPFKLREDGDPSRPLDHLGPLDHSSIAVVEEPTPATPVTPRSHGLLRRVDDEEASELDAADSDPRARRTRPLGSAPPAASRSALAGYR